MGATIEYERPQSPQGSLPSFTRYSLLMACVCFGSSPVVQPLVAISSNHFECYTAVHNSSKSSIKPPLSPETELASFRQGPLPVQVETTENLKEKGGNQQKINTADDIMSKLHMLQVTQFEDFIPTLIAYLVAQTSCFKSGRLAKFTHCWQKISSDTDILQIVSGQYIEFET